MDHVSFVFLDEAGFRTDMDRPRGRAPVGMRLVCAKPGRAWRSITFLAAVTVMGVIAPVVIEGAVDKAVFLAWVEKALIPVLTPGQVVVADSLGAHMSPRIDEMLREVGCTYMHTPKYSPDMNPMENVFSKVKADVRGDKPRNKDEVYKSIAKSIEGVTPEFCRNYYINCGYDSL
jgi:transposase